VRSLITGFSPVIWHSVWHCFEAEARVGLQLSPTEHGISTMKAALFRHFIWHFPGTVFEAEKKVGLSASA
jgi:hypothetical protein